MPAQAKYLDGTELRQVTLHPYVTTNCALGAIAAYKDFAGKAWNPPPEFKLLQRFSGWNRYLVHTGQEEKFGLILEGKEEDSKTWLVAFRGTASKANIYQDMWVNTVPFKPHRARGPFPDNVAVASGFNSLYTDKGGSMKLSMQEQLFKAMEIGKPSIVYVTGHSLGGALASLFALDVASSRPGGVRVVSTTFASPRVGKSGWQSTYDKKVDDSFRIANFWDSVPALPPESFVGYKHVGQQFLVSFYVKDARVIHPISRHAMANYLWVVRKAVLATPQVWEGEFPDQTDSEWTMQSTLPPSKEVPAWEELQHRVPGDFA